MKRENAYEPVSIDSVPAKRRPRWLRRFAILNAILVGLPLVLFVVAYFVLASNGMYFSGASGSLGLATLVLISAYVLVPNLAMLTILLSSKIHR